MTVIVESMTNTSTPLVYENVKMVCSYKNSHTFRLIYDDNTYKEFDSFNFKFNCTTFGVSFNGGGKE